MKKDTIVAIIIGIIIGALFALGVIYFPNIISRVFRSNSQITDLTPSPTIAISTTALSLDITEPLSDAVLFNDKTSIKGKIQPAGKKIIIADTGNESLITTSADNGEFSKEVVLNEGVNLYSISVYDENGNRETKTITLFYTPEKL